MIVGATLRARLLFSARWHLRRTGSKRNTACGTDTAVFMGLGARKTQLAKVLFEKTLLESLVVVLRIGQLMGLIHCEGRALQSAG